MTRGTVAFLVPLTLLLLTGCTEETSEGNKLTVKFALWVPLAVILGDSPQG
jgi:hypothetical protein